MGAFFIYMIMEQFAVAILRHKYNIGGVDYLPQEVTDMLIPQPFSQKFMPADKFAIWQNHIPVYLTVSAIYLLLYIVVSSWRFRKSDL